MPPRPSARPKRGAAVKASQSFAGQVASSSPTRPERVSEADSSDSLTPLSSDDDEPGPTMPGQPAKAKLFEDEGTRLRTPPLARSSSLEALARPRSAVKTTYGSKGKNKAVPFLSLQKIHSTPSSSISALLSPTPSPRAQYSGTARRRRGPSASETTAKRKRASYSGDELDKGQAYFLSPSPMKRKSSKVFSKSFDSGSLPPSQPKLPTRTMAEEIMTGGPWSLDTLGTHVWVCVDEKGQVVSSEEPLDRAFWWPAKMENRVRPVKVTLFKPPRSDWQHTVEIENPSSSNILSHTTTNGQQRFNSATFASSLPAEPSEPQASPRKKFKSNMEGSWKAAVELMHREDEDLNDGLPVTITAILSQKKANGTGKKTRKSVYLKLGSSNGQDAALEVTSLGSPRNTWSPPPPDPVLEIPGELVLSRAGKSREHWPARLLEYKPPMKRKEQAKYFLQFLDQKRKLVPRDWFYTSEQSGFATCMLGKFESRVSAIEDDGDDDVKPAVDERVPSPEPVMPAPAPSDFEDLPIRSQLAYVKPILSLILNKEYEPVRSRHDDFMNGGMRRVQVCKSAAVRGDMSEQDVRELAVHILWWALRGKKVEAEPLDEFVEAATEIEKQPDVVVDASPPSSQPEPPPSSLSTVADTPIDPPLGPVGEESDADKSYVPPPPQHGCPSYEALHSQEKVDYCTNILLPEAIIQVLLWRSGDRIELQPLSPEEETRLRQLGYEKACEHDWVHQVIRLRGLKEKGVPVSGPSPSDKNQTISGTRSRPTRAAITG